MFKTFLNWLFDGKKETQIPSSNKKDNSEGEDSNSPDILKYNSPINLFYILKLFIRDIKMTLFLNENLNNKFALERYKREDLFLFAKEYVLSNRMTRRDIPFIPFRRREKLFYLLQDYFPLLKPFEIERLSLIIDKSEDRDSIYEYFGILIPEKEKIKNSDKKNKSGKKISLKSFIEENFSILKV